MIVQRYAPSDVARQLRPSIPFLVLFGLLFLPQWRRRPTDRWTVPPLPPVLRALSPKDAATRIGIVAFVATIAPFVRGRGVAAAPLPRAGDGADLPVARRRLRLRGTGLAVPRGAGGTRRVRVRAPRRRPQRPVLPRCARRRDSPSSRSAIFLALRAANLSPLFLGFATLAFGAVIDEVAVHVADSSRAGCPVCSSSDRSRCRARALYYLVVPGDLRGRSRCSSRTCGASKTGLALGAMRDSEVGLGALGVDVARLEAHGLLDVGVARRRSAARCCRRADELATPFTYFKFQSLAVPHARGDRRHRELARRVRRGGDLPADPAVRPRAVRPDNVVSTQAIFGDQLEALLPVFFGLGAIALARNPHGLVEQIRSLVHAARPAAADAGACRRGRCGRPLVAVSGGTTLPPRGLPARRREEKDVRERPRSGRWSRVRCAIRRALTPSTIVERWVGSLPEPRRPSASGTGSGTSASRGRARSWIPFEIDVGERSVKVTSHVIIEPDENHAEVYELLLRHNHRARRRRTSRSTARKA